VTSALNSRAAVVIAVVTDKQDETKNKDTRRNKNKELPVAIVLCLQ